MKKLFFLLSCTLPFVCGCATITNSVVSLVELPFHILGLVVGIIGKLPFPPPGIF